MGPAVSVIIPVFDTERYLAECLTSVLNQSFTDIEIIIVSDDSPGDTELLVAQVGGGDSRVRVIRQHPNVGVMKARSIGVSHASGTYLSFVDSDDRVEEWFIERLYAAAVRDDADLVECAFWDHRSAAIVNRWGDARTTIGSQAVFNEFLSGKMSVSVWNKLYRSSIWRTWVESLAVTTGFGEDLLCVFEIVQHCESLVQIPDPGYVYVTRPTGVTLRADEETTAWKLKCLDEVYRHIHQALSTRRETAEAVAGFFEREILWVVRDLLRQYAERSTTAVAGLPAAPPELGLFGAAALGFLDLDATRQADYFQSELNVARQDLLDEVAKLEAVIVDLQREIERQDQSAGRLAEELSWHMTKLSELQQQLDTDRVHYTFELDRRDRSLAESRVRLHEMTRTQLGTEPPTSESML